MGKTTPLQTTVQVFTQHTQRENEREKEKNMHGVVKVLAIRIQIFENSFAYEN